jgi:hypothetical protein
MYLFIWSLPEDVSSCHFTAWNTKMIDKYLSDEEYAGKRPRPV